MKKRLILASGLLAVLGASCTQDETLEVNTQPGITFRAFTENMTRATSIESVGAGGLTSFDVWAFGNSGKSEYDFDNTFTTTDGTNWTAADQTVYHWPGDNTQLKFFAYNGDTFNDNGENGTVSPTIERQSLDNTQFTANIAFEPAMLADNQRDLLVAYAQGTNKENATDGVDLNFRHALSKIVIKATNGADKDYKVEVRGAYLGRYNSQSTLTMPQTSTATQASGTGNTLAFRDWSTATAPTSASEHYKVKNTAAVTLSSTAQTITGTDAAENSFMIIPQNTTAWDASTTDNNGTYISVICRIYQRKSNIAEGSVDNNDPDHWNLIFPRRDAGTAISTLDGKYGLAAVGVGGQIEPGKCYTYTLQFFQNGGGGGVTPPDITDPEDPDVDPEDPNTPVVGGELKFNVTVDTWQKGNGDTGKDTPMGAPDPQP